MGSCKPGKPSSTAFGGTTSRTEAAHLLRDDLPIFAAECLRIRTKSGAIAPLVLNRAQQHVHNRLEAQRRETGRVRAIILKARQQGFSTYVAARFYWRAALTPGLQVFILTHAQGATDNLFSVVERFQRLAPVKPQTSTASAKAMRFGTMDSGYAVGTAGTKAVGRSQTAQLLHASECSHWAGGEGHFAGVFQTVPDLDDTEIILESTANGVGGAFHARWQQAEAGIGDYIAVFVPWFWTEEYRRDPPDGFALDEDERLYAGTHGLDLAQMAWRRAKLAELKDPFLFAQEYPATAAEAFRTSGHDSFIPAELVLAARKAELAARGPLVGGADPARFGDDRFSIAWRQGRKLIEVQSRAKLDVVAGANWLRTEIDARGPRRVFVDVGGVGGGVVDILKSWGAPYDRIVTGVNFGGSPHGVALEGAGAKNRRAEMWAASRDWLADDGGADIPDSDALQADACGPGYSYDANQRLLLEAKDAIRARGVRSPDEWDAVALTFAEPVNEPSGSGRPLVMPNFGVV